MSMNVRVPIKEINFDLTAADDGSVVHTLGLSGDYDRVELAIINADASYDLSACKLQLRAHPDAAYVDYIGASGEWDPVLSYPDDRLILVEGDHDPDALAHGEQVTIIFRAYGANEIKLVPTAETGHTCSLQVRGFAHGCSF